LYTIALQYKNRATGIFYDRKKAKPTRAHARRYTETFTMPAAETLKYTRYSALKGFLKRVAPLIYVLLLVWMNAYVCREAFISPATGHFNSMHGEWIALARLGNFVSLSPEWWPWWGAGVPLEYTYAPLVPMLTAFVSRIEHGSYELAFNQITAATYCLVPVFLYFASWRLSGRAGFSFIAATACSLLSPIGLLMPDQAFHWSAAFDARRLFLLFEWDDLPHAMSLMLLPIAVWSLHRSLAEKRWRFYCLSALTMAAMMLANMFGVVLVSLIILTVPWTLMHGPRIASFMRAVIIACCAYLLICPWLPPSLILTIRRNSVLDGEAAKSSVSLIALCVVAMAAVNVYRLSAGRIRNSSFRWLLVFGSIVLLIPALDYYAGLHFLPQATRYKIEADLAIVWLVVFSLVSIVERMPAVLRISLAVVLVVLAGTQIIRYRRYSKALLRPVETSASIEYRTARWLAEQRPAQRAMLGGSIGQWADAFAEVPQLSAQPYTTTPNFEEYLATYITYSGLGAGDRDAAVSLLWLKAFGVQTIVVPGPASPEYWKPFANPNKFEGILPVLWRERDTTAYDVYSGAPDNSVIRSLAHIVRPGELVQTPPVNGIDVAGIRKYVAALESDRARTPVFRWNGTGRAVIDAQLASGEVLSVQINFYPGWHAVANGREARLRPDGLGLMVVEPGCSGDCHVELAYDGGRELRSCRLASAGFSLLVLAAGIVRLSRHRKFHPFQA
jgi:hypothetical protein